MQTPPSRQKAAFPKAGLLPGRPLALLAGLMVVSCSPTSGPVAVLRPVDRHQTEIDLTSTTMIHVGPLGILPWTDTSHDYLFVPRGGRSDRHGVREIAASDVRFYRGEEHSRPGLIGGITIDRSHHDLRIDLRQKSGKALLPSSRNGSYRLKARWGAV